MKTTECPRTLEQLAPLLGHAYIEWKDWGAKKDDYKNEFFDLANEALKRDGLALKLYEVYAEDEAQATKRAALHNPGWLVDELRPHRVTADLWEVILGEDPTAKAYSIEHEGVKLARQVSRGSVLVDDEYLAERDNDLYKEVTYELPWGQIIVRPIESLEKEIIGRLQPYIYNDRPRVSLRVTPVKEDN